MTWPSNCSYPLTLYWHDYETFGRDPARDRPAQFAGLRTDESLNIIDDPLVIYCKPADDFLPEPKACLITGITPQKALAEGLAETHFIDRINQELSRPGTCGVGYNSIRFDDEFTRHTLYRNLLPPYEREYLNGNSRWDIIDMLRLTRALRPEGINWPDYDTGNPSFRLEDLTRANGIPHEDAHDALADVKATIAMAKLVKTRQPKLYNYIFEHRFKEKIRALLVKNHFRPLVHISRMYGGEKHYLAIVTPLTFLPNNKNAFISFDLCQDPQTLIDAPVDEIQRLTFTPQQELSEGEQRLALKHIHCNRAPVVLPMNVLLPENIHTLKIDLNTVESNLEKLRQAEDLPEKIRQAFGSQPESSDDPDTSLYSGGFFDDYDKHLMHSIRHTPASDLSKLQPGFHDKRLEEMFFRYRCRNFPESLTPDERNKWESYRKHRITAPDGSGTVKLDNYFREIDEMRLSASDAEHSILNELAAWPEQIRLTKS